MNPHLKHICISITTVLLLLLPNNVPADEKTNRPDSEAIPVASSCKAYTPQDLKSIKSSEDPLLIMGAGIVDIIVSHTTSTTDVNLLKLGSSIESPKKAATITLIVSQLDSTLPATPLKGYIEQLLKDDPDNALPFYAYALVQNEEGNSHTSLSMIQKGNTKTFNCYSKERFNAIVHAGELAKCNVAEARANAIINSSAGTLYRQLKWLCPKLIKDEGQSARNVCLTMGKKLEQSSLTMLEGLFSLGIQQQSLDNLPINDEELAQIKIRRNEIIAHVGQNGDVQDNEVNDETVTKYYDLYINKGEMAAQNYLTDYIQKKRSNSSNKK